jgi:hypothetical protein
MENKMLDRNKPVETASGFAVKIAVWDDETPEHYIIGAVQIPRGHWVAEVWGSDGKIPQGANPQLNLVNSPERWSYEAVVNVHQLADGAIALRFHNTVQDAEKNLNQAAPIARRRLALEGFVGEGL